MSWRRLEQITGADVMQDQGLGGAEVKQGQGHCSAGQAGSEPESWCQPLGRVSGGEAGAALVGSRAGDWCCCPWLWFGFPMGWAPSGNQCWVRLCWVVRKAWSCPAAAAHPREHTPSPGRCPEPQTGGPSCQGPAAHASCSAWCWVLSLHSLAGASAPCPPLCTGSCNKTAGPGSCPSVNKHLAHLVPCAALGTPWGWRVTARLPSAKWEQLSMLFLVGASSPGGRSHRAAELWVGSTQSSPWLPSQRPSCSWAAGRCRAPFSPLAASM